MFKLLALSLATLAMTTSTANASTLRLPHKPFAQMTQVQKAHYLRRQIRHDKSIIRFYKHHRTLESAELTHAALWAKKSLKIATHNLRRYTYHPAYASASGFPPHHALWMCEYRHEAKYAPGGWYNRDTGHNSHYGGLQMHYNWGYGINGYAYNYSQLQQEWAAERGYAANHYSHTWLIGQWAHYDCLAYA